MNTTLITGASSGIGAALDRKSTRLNSSHLVISYAVFCLKKKKKSAIRVVQTLARLLGRSSPRRRADSARHDHPAHGATGPGVTAHSYWQQAASRRPLRLR